MRRAFAVAVVALGLMVAACGDEASSGGDTTEVPIEGNVITITARNLQFDQDNIAAEAGSTTFVFKNEDNGLPHNFHLRRGTNAAGDSVDRTEITTGPDEQRLSVTLEAGEYYFQCDPHPNMRGRITVE